MERKIIYPLSECKLGDTLLVNLSSYCADEYEVKIISDTDSSTQMIYYEFHKEQEGSGRFFPVSPGSFKYEYGMNLRIEIFSKNQLSLCEFFGSILDDRANNVGFSYNLFVEDNNGGDQDFNDIVISIHTWRTGE